MRSKKKESWNLKPAIYFGFLVFFIIAVSLLFKALDVIRESKFDGSNRFTVAVLSSTKMGFISVSPKDGTLTRVTIEGILGEEHLKDLTIPYDGIIESALQADAKSYFAKILSRPRGSKTNLTVLDLLRLSLYSYGIDRSKIKEEVIKATPLWEDPSLSTLFADPVILEEKVSIAITNSTDIAGLGNKLAKYITNMGGNVVLVNSSQKEEDKSRIFYQKESYTLKKISKTLNFKTQKSDKNSISDITIVIGKDWRVF